MAKQSFVFEHSIQTFLKLLLILLMLVAVGVGIKYFFNRSSETKLAELQGLITEMQSSINVDSIRQYQIQKIIAIIEQYNINLTRTLKYEIAEQIVHSVQQYYHLNVDLICAVITYETGGTWQPEYVSSFGAMGLMQIMPGIGMMVASVENLNWTSPEEILLNPVINIRLGARYLSALIELYDVDGGLVALMEGQRRAANWTKQGRSNSQLSPDTAEFVTEVMRLYNEYHNFSF